MIYGTHILIGLALLYGIFFPLAARSQVNTSVRITSIIDESLRDRAVRSIEGALASFQDAYATGSAPLLQSDHFTEEGKRAIEELWERAPFRCIFTSLTGPLTRRQSDGRYEFRGATLHLEDRDGTTYTEEGVFVLNGDGFITNLKYGLELHRYTELINDRKEGVQEFIHRQIIIDFVENFKTSYNRKDIAYIESVFGDNALIIVGRVLQERSGDNPYARVVEGLNQQNVEFIRLNKQQYIERLTDVFRKNEYIDVEFDSMSIHRHSEYKGIYGVQLLQHWHSYSTRSENPDYQDTGYLFLMIDLRNIDRPLIHVRTWQPEAFTDPREVINLSNFRVLQ